jgi:F0F1-type ATP synthase membrane subunit b/b'
MDVENVLLVNFFLLLLLVFYFFPKPQSHFLGMFKSKKEHLVEFFGRKPVH